MYCIIIQIKSRTVTNLITISKYSREKGAQSSQSEKATTKATSCPQLCVRQLIWRQMPRNVYLHVQQGSRQARRPAGPNGTQDMPQEPQQQQAPLPQPQQTVVTRNFRAGQRLVYILQLLLLLPFLPAHP